jgi:predicted amidophosphoribosyltransferase
MNNNNAISVSMQVVDADVGSTLARYSVTRPRRCRKCGTDVSRGLKRCPTCGQPLSVRSPDDAG